jgi:uncharacterized membrane protein
MEKYYIIITIALIAIMLGVVFWRQKQQKVNSTINKQEPETGAIKSMVAAENKRRIAISAAVVAMVVGIGFAFFNKSDLGSFSFSYSSSDSSGPWNAMWPIWIVIWILFMNKKKKQEPSAKQKRMLLVLVGLTLLVVLGIIAFKYFNN